jgi:hypothetical protein
MAGHRQGDLLLFEGVVLVACHPLGSCGHRVLLTSSICVGFLLKGLPVCSAVNARRCSWPCRRGAFLLAQATCQLSWCVLVSLCMKIKQSKLCEPSGCITQLQSMQYAAHSPGALIEGLEASFCHVGSAT